MCRSAALAVSLLLCTSAFCPPSSAQEVQSDSARLIVAKLPPTYPDLARKLNLEGIVRLRVTVAPNGTVRFVETVGGNPLLAKAAEQAVSKWTWARATEESRELVEVKFHLH